MKNHARTSDPRATGERPPNRQHTSSLRTGHFTTEQNQTSTQINPGRPSSLSEVTERKLCGQKYLQISAASIIGSPLAQVSTPVHVANRQGFPGSAGDGNQQAQHVPMTPGSVNHITLPQIFTFPSAPGSLTEPDFVSCDGLPI